MAKKRKNDDAVVNIATPGSVVGIQSGGSISGSAVTVNGPTTNSDSKWGGGRWVDIEDMDRSLWSDPDNPDY
ncbi:hypothetical protein ACFY1A_48210 [Streptomyces sp. NPDC001520]|uniref:hypothetical protein n=1 Tax=Streptomyces sp. NPDC001520 TaxID=3364581 RepID=UPI00369E9C24